MTTNSLNQLNIELNKIEKKDPNIQITRSLGSTIEFLDVLVTNDHGQLKTSVFHKPAAEPYLLPYLSEHPRHIHRNTIRGALFRAVRLCSHVEDFDQERLQIELRLLLNGYPLKFITYHFKQFFEQHNAMSILDEPNQMIYQIFHKKLLTQLSRHEKQTNGELISNNNNNTLQKQQQNQSKLTVHFTFETGPMLQFKHELRCLWEKYYIYKGSRMNNVRLEIGTRSNKSLCQLLVKKKPPKSMLTDVTLGQTATIANTTSN